MPAISTKKNRSTGNMITVWDNRTSDLTDDGSDEPWYSICDEHSTLVSHETRSLATLHSVWPKGWCECCRNHEGDRDGSTAWYGCPNCNFKATDTASPYFGKES